MGKVIAKVIGQSHFFNPPLLATSPPNIPPRSSPTTPTTPFTTPNASKESANPPFSDVALRNNGPTVFSNASGKRNKSIKAIATKTSFFRKKLTNVSKNSLKSVDTDNCVCSTSVIGFGNIHL